MNKIKHTYIHIPFCKYICVYCDFCKRYYNKSDVMSYLNKLVSEIKVQEEVKSLYIGGGTPSCLSLNETEFLLKEIEKKIAFANNYEYTFECNPDDITEELAKKLKRYGVNRISIGVQTIIESELEYVKRLHKKDDVVNGFEILNKYFSNISLDFIFNLPNQKLESINTNLQFISDFQEYITNVSYYGLILEGNTILDTMDYQVQSEEVESDWYKLIQLELKKLGFVQYEISNFAKEGYESIHNLAYWQQKEYYGYGISASSYINNKRITNTYNMKKYLNDQNIIGYSEDLTKEDHLIESIMLGLRTKYGIDRQILEDNKIDYNLEYFDIKDKKLIIKEKYLYITNEIILSLISNID